VSATGYDLVEVADRDLAATRNELACLVDRADALVALLERATLLEARLRRAVALEDLYAEARGERDRAALQALLDRIASTGRDDDEGGGT
jgi:hypothetical protein